jgi:hypothetical protein
VDWDYNSNFKGAGVAGKYEGKHVHQVWGEERTSPTTGRDRTFAVLGGWPVRLMYEECPGELVLTALASTEPLIDVWRVGDDFNAVVHVT